MWICYQNAVQCFTPPWDISDHIWEDDEYITTVPSKGCSDSYWLVPETHHD